MSSEDIDKRRSGINDEKFKLKDMKCEIKEMRKPVQTTFPSQRTQNMQDNEIMCKVHHYGVSAHMSLWPCQLPSSPSECSNGKQNDPTCK